MGKISKARLWSECNGPQKTFYERPFKLKEYYLCNIYACLKSLTISKIHMMLSIRDIMSNYIYDMHDAVDKTYHVNYI